MCERHDCPIKNKIIKKGLEESLNILVEDYSITHVRRVLKTINSMLSNKTSCQTIDYLTKRCNDVANNLEGFSSTTNNDDRVISVLVSELKTFLNEN